MESDDAFHRCSRRDFLTVSGLGVGAGAWALASLADPVQSATTAARLDSGGVELAIASICLDGFGHMRHQSTFNLLPRTPFRNVEFNLWYPETITPRYLETLRKRCQALGLRPVCLQGLGFGGEGPSGISKDLSHKMALIHGCRQLGCRRIKCTGARRGTQGGLDSLIEVLKELAPMAEAMDTLVLLENHAQNVLEQIEDYEQIFDQIDSKYIGMCLDTGHFEGVGVDLLEVIDRFQDRILHVDLKDCRQRGAGHDTVVFGQGVTDFSTFLDRLLSRSYSGFLVIEQAWRDPEPADSLIEHLQAAWRQFESYQTTLPVQP